MSDRRRANVEVYGRMLAAQNSGDRDAWLACLADDVVFEAPYYRADGPIAAGLPAMSATFDRLSDTFSSISYQIKRIIPALDEDLVIAEVKGDNVVIATGKHYCNDYLFLVSCRDGKVQRIFEYSNPQVYAAAVNA